MSPQRLDLSKIKRVQTSAVSVGGWTIETSAGGLPSIYEFHRDNAAAVFEFGHASDDAGVSFVGLRRHGADHNEIVIAQRFWPSGSGFDPAALITSDPDRLFVGAGERILYFDLDRGTLIWEDVVEMGFWGWSLHADVVVMSGELSFTVFDRAGAKLWSTFVEPPWGYECAANTVTLDVMGVKARYRLRSGEKCD